MLLSSSGLQIRVQHWGDDQHILVIFLILAGGGGLILRFLEEIFVFQILVLPNLCFSTHSLHLFSFFLLNSLFSPFLGPDSLSPNKISPSCILHPHPHPQIFFAQAMVDKYCRMLSNGQKSKLLGDGGQILGGGGMYPRHPPRICSPDHHYEF